LKKRVTIKDVAAAAGVSRQTVSRAINNQKEISPATKARVLQTVAELGYQPNRLARGMVTRRTGTVALLVSDIANRFFRKLPVGFKILLEPETTTYFSATRMARLQKKQK